METQTTVINGESVSAEVSTMKVRAAKTRGACRKAIAEASQILGVNQTLIEKQNFAIELLRSGGMDEKDIANFSQVNTKAIASNTENARRNLLSVINAIANVFDKVKELDTDKLLPVTRTLLEYCAELVPETEAK